MKIAAYLTPGDLADYFGPVTAVEGLQFGDEGKGKLVGVLGYVVDADLFGRWAGGPNAGHTQVFDGQTYKLHGLPSGVTYPNSLNVIGNGCVVDPVGLRKEIDGLAKRGFKLEPCSEGSYDGDLVIGKKTHIIAPWCKEIDEFRERARGPGRIGTTGRGIGPTYMYKAGRSEALRFYDILDADRFEKRIMEIAESERRQLETRLKETLPDVWEDPDYEKYIETQLNGYQKKFEKMGEELYPYCESLVPYVGDSSEAVRTYVEEGLQVIFEGAQGTAIDVDHGTYPKVTSSNSTIGGVRTGLGYNGKIDTRIGVVKAYVSRVGAGAFPTKLGGELRDRIVRVGKEYGTTTGRERDTGWLDLVQVEYSSMLNHIDKIAVTKLDVLTEAVREVKVCYAYEIDGSETTKFPADDLTLQRAVPQYHTIDNFPRLSVAELIKQGERERFEKPVQQLIDYIEEAAKAPVTIISVSPDRDDTMFLI